MCLEDSRRKELVRAARDVIFGSEKVIYTPKLAVLATSVVKGILRGETRQAVDSEAGGDVVTFVLRRQAQIRSERIINRILGFTRLGDNLLEFC